MPTTTIAVPAAAVGGLRRIALEDYEGIHGSDESDEQLVRLLQYPERLLDKLGWKAPVEGDCKIKVPVDPDYLRSLLGAAGDEALSTLEAGSGTRAMRRDELARLRCCVTVFEALEEGAQVNDRPS